MQQSIENNFPFNFAGLVFLVLFVVLLSQALSPASLVVGLHLFAAALCLGGEPSTRPSPSLTS